MRSCWLTLLLLLPCDIAAGQKKVVAIHPVRADIVRRITLPATAHADLEVDVFAKVAGFVDSIDVDVGTRVQAGALLARLRVPEMEAELPLLRSRVAEAQAIILQAQIDADAVDAEIVEPQVLLELLKKAQESAPSSVAEKDVRITAAQLALAEAHARAKRQMVATAKARLAVAEADLTRAQALLELAEIPAPFDAVVTARHADPGTLVAAANTTRSQILPIVTLVNDDVIRVHVCVPEQEVTWLRLGTLAELRFDALRGTTSTARVSRIAGSLDAKTRTQEIEIDLGNSDHAVRPGMFGHVTLELETRPAALSIPSSALFEVKSKIFVLALRNGVAERIEVQIGLDDGVRAEILNGLHEEDAVARMGRSAAAEGEAIEAVFE